MSTDGDCMKKIWFMYAVEDFSAMRKELLPFEATQMDLEGIMLGVIRQKDEVFMLSCLYVGSQNVEIIHRVDWWS